MNRERPPPRVIGLFVGRNSPKGRLSCYFCKVQARSPSLPTILASPSLNMSLAARASFVSDSESQVYEAQGELSPSAPPFESSPRPLSFPALRSQQKSTLSIEKRLELIQRQLEELDGEFAAVTHVVEHRLQDPVAEMRELVLRANGVAKEVGTQGVDWMWAGEGARRLAAAIAGGSSAQKDVTCAVIATFSSPPEDVSTQTKEVERRITALEAATGAWQPSFGFLTLSQSLSSCKRTTSKLDSSQVAALDDLAENITTELDVVNYRREMLFGADSDQMVIEQLYDLLTDLSRVQPALPLLVARLNDLKKVHEEGAQFKQRLEEVAGRLEAAEKQLGRTGVDLLIVNWQAFKDGLQSALAGLHSNA